MSTSQQSEVAAASGQHEQRVHGGITPLKKPARKRRVDPDVALRKVVQQLAEGLPRCAGEGQWAPLLRATEFLLWLTQHVPGSAAVFISARGTARLQDAIRAAAGSADPSAVGMLQPGTALLLHCVRLSESAADLVVESQSVRLLLQLLLRADVGPATKRHTADILAALAATKLVYRDVLHGAGVVDSLMAALTDASCLADLSLVQVLLWVLISLSDDDDVYKDDMREAGLPALLVALFSVYQAHQGAAELRPIAAQILRCLHLMAHDDAPMQDCCRSLGLIRLLAAQLHCDIHSLDEPPPPPAAANILTASNCPSTPKSPHKLPSSSGSLGPGASGGPLSGSLTPIALGPPGSPLRRSGSGNSSSAGSPRAAGLLPAAAAVPAAHGRRASGVEPPIPEDSEADLPLPDSPVAAPHHMLLGRAGYAPHSSEAAALRGLGAGPPPLTRLAAALLLRVVLAGLMSPRTIEVALHGVLLPALHMQLVGPRLSLAAEATAALRALLADCPANQEAAAAAGVVPLMVQLLSARNIDLASAAAEVVTIIAGRGASSVQPHTPAAVAGLAGLLKECAAHAYMLGLARRRSSTSGSSTAVAAASSTAQQTHAAATADMLLRPIPETDTALGSSSGVDVASAAVPEHVSGTAWSAERQTAQHPQLLQPVTSVVMRHPSLNRDGTASVQQQQAGFFQQHNYQQPRQSQAHLTSRERPRFSMGPSAAGPSGSCLVCEHTAHESCGFCPLSSALSALLVLCQPPTQQLQSLLMDGGCLTVVVGLIAGELGASALEYSRLLVSLAELLSLAVTGNSTAQDLVRLSGGVDVLVAAFNRLAASAAARDSPAAPQLCISLLGLLAALAAGNSANKLCMREAGAFSGMAVLLDLVLVDTAAQEQDGHSVTDKLAAALLDILACCLPESPGSQGAAHQAGITAKLLALLRLPCPGNTPGRGLGVIRALGLLGHKGQPAAQADVTAGGLVAVVMNVLQQQAMAGVLVAEVCMTVLPTLLDCNPTGKQQALQYGLLPLLVHLLRSSPSPVTLTAAAQTLAVLAQRDTELQGQIAAAGGLTALLDKLDPANSNSTPDRAAEAQTAAAAEAAAAAAAAAVEAVARAAEDACGGSSGGDDGATAEPSSQQQQPLPDAAASIFSAVEGAAAKQSLQHQQPQQPGPGAAVDAAAAAAKHALGVMRVKVACLEAVAALSHDNMFVKNTARQQGVMLLLVDLLRMGSTVLQTEVAQQQQQQALLHKATPHKHQMSSPYPVGGSSNSSPSYSQLEHSSSYWSGGQGQLFVRTQSQQTAAGHSQQEQQQEQRLQLQLQQQQLAMLVAAVRVLGELCHGNHSNQQAAAAEGLLDALTSLAATALGDSLEAASHQRHLLAAIADAIAAASEFCTPNKLVARESGAVDVLSRLLLMAAEAPDMASQLSSLRLFPVVASACGAVVALAQDCEEDQRAFTANPDFLPALFRLLSVDDPTAATQAARALEFIAIRNDYAEDADDRPEFEADTALALIRTLTHGAIAISGSGRGAAARVTTGPGGPGSAGGPSAAVIKAASDLLALVVEASDASSSSGQLAGAAAGASSAAGGSSAIGRTISGPSPGSSGSAIAASGLGTAPAHPAAVPAGTASKRQLQPQGSTGKPGGSSGAAAGPNGSSDVAGGMSGIDPLSRPAALMPAVMTDHTSGLAVLRTWSMQEDNGGLWQALVARTAPAFQHIRASLPEGPRKPFRLQVGWLLLLLAAKNANNRAIISRVQRTTLAPLAMQLENAERFFQVAAEAEAASEAAAAAAGGSGAAAVEHSAEGSAAGGDAHQQPPSMGQSALAGGDSLTSRPSGGPAAEDDEISMLQAEVAFLGLHSSSRTTSMDG